MQRELLRDEIPIQLEDAIRQRDQSDKDQSCLEKSHAGNQERSE
jgi:hypothetical protein